jgi:hypothetical protein
MRANQVHHNPKESSSISKLYAVLVGATAQRVAEQATAAQLEAVRGKEALEATCSQLRERAEQLKHLQEDLQEELQCAEHSRVRAKHTAVRPVTISCKRNALLNVCVGFSWTCQPVKTLGRLCIHSVHMCVHVVRLT